MTQFLTSHDKINDRQHGFRSDRGTHTALATLYETISRDIRQGHNIDIVLRDVSKAFDKVWHDGLKYKLSTLSLHDCFIRTLCDYLDDRTASIRLTNYIGPTFKLHSGVPQGACLSPTLYNFFTHDIPNPIPKTDFICFADDITQIISDRCNPDYLAKLTERAIKQINSFENNWKIKTNTTKFTLLPISRRKTAIVSVDDKIIPYKSQGKVLGLSISTRGFQTQIKQRTAVAKRRLLKLNRFKKLSTKNKLLLYTSTVRAALLYPIIPLHTASKTQIIKLQRIQNRATRFISGKTLLDRCTSISLHNECNLKPINLTLHQYARDTWNKIEASNPNIFDQFPTQTDNFSAIRKTFISSKKLALSPSPDPIYA